MQGKGELKQSESPIKHDLSLFPFLIFRMLVYSGAPSGLHRMHGCIT